MVRIRATAGRYAVLLLLLSGLNACKSLYLQEDNFPEKLKEGCNTEDECDRLIFEATKRDRECQPNTIGYLKCEDTHRDLRTAEDLKRLLVEQRRRAVQAAAEEEREKQQADRAHQRQLEEAQFRAQQQRIREFEEGVRLYGVSVPRFYDMTEACSTDSRDLPVDTGCVADQHAWMCTAAPYDGCERSNVHKVPPVWCCESAGCAFSREHTNACREKLHPEAIGISCTGDVPMGCQHTVEYGGKSVHCCNVGG